MNTYRDLDLDPTKLNIELVRAIFIFYNVFQFRVPRSISFRVIVQKHTHTHKHTQLFNIHIAGCVLLPETYDLPLLVSVPGTLIPLQFVVSYKLGVYRDQTGCCMQQIHKLVEWEVVSTDLKLVRQWYPSQSLFVRTDRWKTDQEEGGHCCQSTQIVLIYCTVTVPVTSDRTSVFSAPLSQNSVPKLTYFKTQSYLVLSLAL